MADYYPYKLKLWGDPTLAGPASDLRSAGIRDRGQTRVSWPSQSARFCPEALFPRIAATCRRCGHATSDRPNRIRCSGSSTSKTNAIPSTARWIPKLLEFAKHSGEKLLGVGHGLGTDWVQYAQNGAVGDRVQSGGDRSSNWCGATSSCAACTGRFIQAEPTSLAARAEQHRRRLHQQPAPRHR